MLSSTSSSSPTHPPTSANQLLTSLPPEEYARLSPLLSPFELKLGQVLAEPGQKPQQVYFVEKGMLSYVLSPQTGLNVEVGVIGSEGVANAGATLAEREMAVMVIAQAVGSAQVMDVEAFRSEVRRSDGLYKGVMRHLDNISLQASQSVLCNRQHTTEERLSRWLLMVQDRVPQDVLELKGSFLATMLGSRESGVAVASGILRKAGLINFEEERLEILDRKGLEAASCECYAALRHTSTLAS